MKKIFALLVRAAGLDPSAPYCGDSPRAQTDEHRPQFSFWRALVS